MSPGNEGPLSERVRRMSTALKPLIVYVREAAERVGESSASFCGVTFTLRVAGGEEFELELSFAGSDGPPGAASMDAISLTGLLPALFGVPVEVFNAGDYSTRRWRWARDLTGLGSPLSWTKERPARLGKREHWPKELEPELLRAVAEGRATFT